MDTGSVHAKYLFLDVVNYSLNRPSEAQVDIINSMNEIVTKCVQELKIEEKSRVYISTGDGICIGLINIKPELYDINLNLALSILNEVDQYNSGQTDKTRKFYVRIGLNENVDNLIVDINGNQNLSGSGINLSQRIMSLADGGNILVSQQVHEVLANKEKYFTSFKQYSNQQIKHGKINVFQYLNSDIDYLNNGTPSALAKLIQPEPKTSKLIAAFFALLKRDEDKIIFMTSKEGGYISSYTIIVAYWYLAKDYIGVMNETRTNRHIPISPEKTLDETISLLESVAYRIRSEFSHLIHRSTDFEPWIWKLSGMGSQIYLNDEGLAKIKKDWPEIVDNILKL